MRAALRTALSTRCLTTWASVAVVILPIVTAALRAAVGEWVPTGDDAYFTVRSRDVLTSDHPFVGAWSSGSLDRTSVNNLGPLQLDLLAPFTRWTPFGGTAIGTASINVAALIATAALLFRIGGRSAVLVSMPAIGLLTWTMGSEMLITPRQHQAMILPYLCLLVAAWAVARGDRWATVVGVVAGSLVVQTHLSYPILVVGLAVAALIVHIHVVRGLVVRGGDPAPNSSRRPYTVAVAVGVALWSQSLFEQFFRDGNIGTALFSSGEGGQAGFGDGIGIVARVLVSPHTLLRPGFQRFDAGLTPAGPASVAILVIAVVAASAWIVILLRRRDLSRAAGPIVALVAVLAGILDATLLPETAFGYPVGNYRWLWATGAFVVVVVLVDLVPRVEARVDDRVVAAVAGAFCTAVAVANLWPSVEYDQESVYRRQTGEVAVVVEQLAATDLPESLIVDSSDVTFGTPIVYPVLIELQRQGVAFRFDDDTQISRFGSGRVADGSEVGRLTIVTGPAASGLGADPQLVASSQSVAGQPVAILLEPLDP